VREALNFHLKPAPVAVLECETAAHDFDARYSATARHYRYRILCRRAPPALDRDRVWWMPIALDGEAMGEAAKVLLGRHDFTTFRAAQCQANSPLRTLDRLDVSELDEEIVIEASARSFLHNQVRSMVGSLKLVGEGKWRTRDLKAALDARNRSECGPVASASGLYLVRVDYGPPALAPEELAEDDD
jgi:tRNA pseudouridine38-40 synthase